MTNEQAIKNLQYQIELTEKCMKEFGIQPHWAAYADFMDKLEALRMGIAALKKENANASS